MSLSEFETRALLLLTEIRDALRSRPIAASATPGTAGPVVSLDGKYDDPEIKKDPPRYNGPPLAPCRMSQGSPEWLEQVASFKLWQASKARETNEVTSTGKPKAGYLELDAARAKAWAARLRTGWKPAAEPAESMDFGGSTLDDAGSFGDDTLPF